MPRYDYQCPKCGAVLERTRSIDQRHELLYCESPRCNDDLQPMELVITTTAAIHVKGGTT